MNNKGANQTVRMLRAKTGFLMKWFILPYGKTVHNVLLNFLDNYSNFFGSMIWASSWQNQQNGCAPSKDSDQPGWFWSVLAVHIKKAWVLSYPMSAQQRLWSDWVDAQADLSLQYTHSHFVGFFMRRLNYILAKGLFTAQTLHITRILLKRK